MMRVSHIAIAAALLATLPGCKPKEDSQQQTTQATKPQASPFDQYDQGANDIIVKDKPGDIAASPAQLGLTPVMPAADLVVSQSGATTARIAKIQFLGPADVTLTHTCQLQQDINSLGTCTVHLSYTPKDTVIDGQILIVHSGASSPILIPVHADARLAAGGPNFSVDLAALKHQAVASAVSEAVSETLPFGNVAPEQEEAPQSVYPMDPMHPANKHVVAASPPRDMSRIVSRFQHITMTSQTETFVEQDAEVNATLDFPVYGGRNPVTGQEESEPLLPAGTMVKAYCHPARNTNERGECYVTTMETPDNRTVDFKSLRLYDAMGRPGVPGDLDERYVERYGPGAFMSLLSAATILASPDSSTSTVGLGTTTQTESASRQAANQLAADIHSIAGKIADESAAKSPRLSIPKATVMDLMLVDDLYIPRPGELIADRDGAKQAEKVDRPRRAFDSISTGDVIHQQQVQQPAYSQTAAQQAALNYAQLQAAATAAAQAAAQVNAQGTKQ